MRTLALALLAAGCATTPAPPSAGPAIFRAVDVSGPDVDVAGFVRITNTSPTADRLVALACACAERVEIHNTFDGDMHVLPSLDIPAGQATDIRPGGPTHLMLMGMKSPHAAGDTISLTLTFASGVTQTIPFTGVANSAEGWEAALED